MRLLLACKDKVLTVPGFNNNYYANNNHTHYGKLYLNER